MKKINLLNKRFGRLLVIEETFNRSGASVVWKCICDCGRVKNISSYHLLSGATKSCGCLRKEIVSLQEGESAQNKLFLIYITNANNRNILFDLSFEDFVKLTKQNCYYCGIEPKQVLKLAGGNGFYTYNGIDRINNSLGYTAKNCVPCCKQCNFSKKDLSISEFYSWVARVYLKKELDLSYESE